MELRSQHVEQFLTLRDWVWRGQSAEMIRSDMAHPDDDLRLNNAVEARALNVEVVFSYHLQLL